MKYAISTIITTTCLVGALASGLAMAAPRKAPARSAPAPLLTVQEQECEALGRLAAAIAASRDTGVPPLTLVQTLRRVSRQYHTPAAEQAWRERLLYVIYDSRSLTPAMIRQHTERTCLQEGTPLEQAPAAPDARLRY